MITNLAPGWLLLVFLSGPGGGSVSAVGTFATPEQCDQAADGVSALITQQKAANEASHTPGGWSASWNCVVIGNPSVSVGPDESPAEKLRAHDGTLQQGSHEPHG